MILTLIAVALILVGVILLIVDKVSWMDLECGYAPCLFFGIIGLFIFLTGILISHSAVDLQINNDNIKYESLCKRLDIVNSEYEDISKSDVIADIAEWNADVASYKYWTESPWTNWFHVQEIADNLKYIPLE